MNEKNKENKKSNAKKIRLLIKKQKGLLWAKKSMVKFKEPIVFLMRRTGKIEFYENATSGEFEYEHSNGRTNKILLSPEYQHTFDYGSTYFKGYILHEDNATPLPDKPLVSAELFSIALDKTLHDIKTWKAKELEAKGQLIWKIGMAVGLVIVAITFYYMIVSNQAPPTTATAVKTVAKNVSLAVLWIN